MNHDDAFLLSCLIDTEDDYALSSSVALAVFEKLPRLATVVFPSRRQTGALNFAVRHDTVWRDWGIVSVRAAHARHLAMREVFMHVSRDCPPKPRLDFCFLEECAESRRSAPGHLRHIALLIRQSLDVGS